MPPNNIVMFTQASSSCSICLGIGSLIDLIVCRSSNPSADDPGTAPPAVHTGLVLDGRFLRLGTEPFERGNPLSGGRFQTLAQCPDIAGTSSARGRGRLIST